MSAERKEKLKAVGKLLIIDICVLAMVYLVLMQVTVFFKIYYIPTPSMETTISVGDVTIGVKPKEINRGDIITFRDDFEDSTLLKRVIGLPGEAIAIKEGIIYINGEALNEPYISNQEFMDMDVHVLANDEYFMMGDNRLHSLDSRQTGPIKEENIEHKIVYRILPLDRMGAIND